MIPNPNQIQSKPLRGKIKTYIKIVQGAKIKPRIPTNHGKLKPANAVVTLTGAINQYTRKARRGPKNRRDAKKQHIVYSP
jgi:hypothetical protein